MLFTELLSKAIYCERNMAVGRCSEAQTQLQQNLPGSRI